MMDVLPPKWTELFQHQEEQEIADQQEQQIHNESAHSHRSYHWHTSPHYNTYHDACTMHPYHHHLPPSPRKFRTQSYSSTPPTNECPEKENEMELRGTRFRLTKATIRMDDEDEDEQHHQQLNTHYV